MKPSTLRACLERAGIRASTRPKLASPTTAVTGPAALGGSQMAAIPARAGTMSRARAMAVMASSPAKTGQARGRQRLGAAVVQADEQGEDDDREQEVKEQ